jgi:hypothetical protein
MTDDNQPKKKRKHGGVPSDQLTISKRVDDLYGKFCLGWSRQKLKHYAASEEGWSCSDRAFEEYWKRLRARVDEVGQATRHEVWADCVTRLETCTQMAFEQRNPSAAQASIATIAKLAAVDPTLGALWTKVQKNL